MVERNAQLRPFTPSYAAGAAIPLPLEREREVVGNADDADDFQLRAALGKIADDTVDNRIAIVEDDLATFQRPETDGSPPIVHQIPAHEDSAAVVGSHHLCAINAAGGRTVPYGEVKRAK